MPVGAISTNWPFQAHKAPSPCGCLLADQGHFPAHLPLAAHRCGNRTCAITSNLARACARIRGNPLRLLHAWPSAAAVRARIVVHARDQFHGPAEKTRAQPFSTTPWVTGRARRRGNGRPAVSQTRQGSIGSAAESLGAARGAARGSPSWVTRPEVLSGICEVS